MSTEQILGLATGIVFGILLQQGRVLRFEKQVGALLFQDMTIIKFMFSAVIVGTVGIYSLAGLNLIQLSVKGTSLGGNLVGGCLFGIGWALAGYCPGTSIGALGEGRWHALWVILGMIVGAAIYAELYPLMLTTVLSWGDLGKITLPGVLGVSPWMVITFFILICLGLFAWFEKKGV
jgi:hypothetical protein